MTQSTKSEPESDRHEASTPCVISTASPPTSRHSRVLPASSTATSQNLQPMPGVFPDYRAPVVRNTDTGTEMVTIRWGMPPPPRTPGAPVTNIRNTSSPHWRMWLKPENRCLVPANSFAEYAPEPRPRRKTWCGSRSMRIVRCSRSLASGRRSTEIAARSRSRYPDRIRCMAS